MSELHRLAVNLAPGSGRTARWVHGVLHLAGLRGAAAPTGELLRLLAEAEGDFEALGAAYPNVLPWTSLLAEAGGLLALLTARAADRACDLGPGSPVKRASTSASEFLFEMSGVAQFVAAISIPARRTKASGLVRAAAYLAGAMRQGGYQLIPGWEDAVDPDGWLTNLVGNFCNLDQTADCETQSIEANAPLEAIALECSRLELGQADKGEGLVSSAERPLSEAIGLLAKVLKSPQAAKLGEKVAHHFSCLDAIASNVPGQAEFRFPAVQDDEGLDDSDEVDEVDTQNSDDADQAAEGDGRSSDGAPAGGPRRPRGPWKRGDRSSRRLTESALLGEHRRAFSPGDEAEMVALIESTLSEPKRLLPGTRPPREGFFDVLIAAVARCTGRTIAAAARTRLIDFESLNLLEAADLPKERCLFFGQNDPPERAAFKVGYFGVAAVSDGAGEAPWTLFAMPESLSALLRRLVPGVIDAELEELLPFIPGGWGEQAGQWLASRFLQSVGDFNLANRHGLAREIYAATSNRALVELTCTDPLNSDHTLARPVALGTYLSPCTHRDQTEYLRAASKLIGRESIPSMPKVWRPEFVYVPKEVLREIGASLRLAAETKDTALSRHPAVATYTLTTLVLGTGHRYSDHVFHFPWDLDLDAAVAFVCDKLKIGSEARFVPLIRLAVRQFQAYRFHLTDLIKEILPTNPDLARDIAAAAGLPDPVKKPKRKPVQGHPVGQFFLIEGNSIATIRSADIDRLCRQSLAGAPGMLLAFDLSVGNGSLTKTLRKNLATYLWTAGLPGALIEAFLGHNRQFHAFGAASTWSVLHDLDRVRQAIEQYFDAIEWQVLDLGPAVESASPARTRLPSRRTGTDGYEGRGRDAALAHTRARRAVHQTLFALASENAGEITLNDEAIATLRDEAAEALGPDAPARDKLLQAFASLAATFKRDHKIRISAASVAAQRTEPGPVEIGFGRDLAIAQAMRTGWAPAVLSLLGEGARRHEVTEDLLLAVVATSMVINDAILDTHQLWPLLDSIRARQVRNAQGRAQVRAGVTSPRADFERVVYLSRVTTAAIAGLFRSVPQAPPPDHQLDRDGIERHVAAMVAEALGDQTQDDWNLAALASTFRAWWFLRLPGFAFSIATGAHDSPSCDFVSEATLLGADPGRDAKQVERMRSARRAPVDAEVRLASRQISAMLERVTGSQVKGTQSSRRQRQELRKVFQMGVSPELAALMLAVPMAELRVGFIEHLLVRGGIEKEVLAFGTILTYDDRLTALYAAWWKRNPKEFSSEEFDAEYMRLVQAAAAGEPNRDLQPLMTALRNFHVFLKQSEGVPDAPYLGLSFSQTRRGHPRASLLAPRLFPAALSASREVAGDDVQSAEDAVRLLSVCHSYGTRRKEALYCQSDDFTLYDNRLAMLVKSNAFNKLKNPKFGTRLIPQALASDEVAKMVIAATNVKGSVNAAGRPLFSDPTAENRLVDFDRTAAMANAALKLSSGNARMSLHGERHGFATRLGLAFMPPAGNVPPIRRIRSELTESESGAAALAKLMPSAIDWPFQIKRASMWHGNAGVDNYLNVYFHGGSWILAEHADANALDGAMHPAQWAALMGMSRTNIVKLRSAWKASEGDGADLSDERVVAHFLGRLALPDAAKLEVPAASNAVAPEAVVTLRLSLPMADRLLVRRCEENLSLDGLIDLAVSEHRLERSEVKGFISRYADLIADSGLIDFEPAGGELISEGKTNAGGVARSAPRRQALLARIESMHRREPTQETLRRILAGWCSRVDPRRPLLLARQPEELTQLLQVLDRLGFMQAELRVAATRAWHAKYGESSSPDMPIAVDHAPRLSRGLKAVLVAEACIEVIDRVGEASVNNADLHRALLVAHAHLA